MTASLGLGEAGGHPLGLADTTSGAAWIRHLRPNFSW